MRTALQRLVTGALMLMNLAATAQALPDVDVGRIERLQIASRHVAAIVHCAAQHVGPDGGVVVFGEGHEDAADRFDLTEQRRIAVEGAQITVLRRTERVTIHDKVFEARSRIARITPLELADRLASESARPSSIPARQPIGLVSG